MSRNDTLATQNARWCRQVTPAPQNVGRCCHVPRLPRRMKVDVTKCHACHANSHSDHGTQARHQSHPSAISATPATQNAGRCYQVPRLSRKQPQRSRDPSAPPESSQCHKCHACPAECRSMSPCATLATQNEGRCHQVPRLSRKQPQRSLFAWQAWHLVTSTCILRGRRGTYGTGMALVARLGPVIAVAASGKRCWGGDVK